MAKVDLYEITDIIGHARELGYDWNHACDFLQNDEIGPMYEITKRTHDLSDIDQYGYSPDTIKVMKSFFAQEGLTSFVVVGS